MQNLSDFYRYERVTGKAASNAIERARARLLTYKNATAHLETMSARLDARRIELNEAKAAAAHLAGQGGAPYEAAAQRVTQAVAALDQTERARKMALKEATRVYMPGKPYASYNADSGLTYIEMPESYGFRHVGNVAADTPRGEIWDKSEHTGWYTDPYNDTFTDGDGLCRGVVYQLPALRGHARFVAGYQFGGTDAGPTLDLRNIFEADSVDDNCSYGGAPDNPAARDAARSADSMAQNAAEKTRNYQTAWELGRIYSEAKEEAQEARAAALVLLAERRAVKKSAASYPTICEAIRASVSGYLRSIQAARETMRNAADGDNAASGFCVYMSQELQSAFCEGAEIETFPA